MTLRSRLTVWYAVILFASLALITILSYREFHKMPVDAADSEEDSEAVLRVVLRCGIPAAILGLGGGWLLMRRALDPIQRLTHAAQRIHEYNLIQKLPQTGSNDEVDELTAVFNGMTERLHDSFQRIRQFTLHASHELKTPLAILHAQLETALQDRITPAERRELMMSQMEEVQRLGRIVDGLTLLTKADAEQIVLPKIPLRLDDLIREAHADALILAQPHNIRVNLKPLPDVIMAGDRDRLRQLLLNLSDNAIKHNEPNGEVEFELSSHENTTQLVISNTGPGISADLLPEVFNPFFRGRLSVIETEGSGLGLSIAKWIVAAHGGKIEITSDPGKRTTVVVQFPTTGKIA